MITGFNSQTWPRIIGIGEESAMQAMMHDQDRTSRGHACHEESKTSYGVEGRFNKIYQL